MNVNTSQQAKHTADMFDPYASSFVAFSPAKRSSIQAMRRASGLSNTGTHVNDPYSPTVAAAARSFDPFATVSIIYHTTCSHRQR